MTTRTLLFGAPAATGAPVRGVDAGLLVLRLGMFALLAFAHGMGKLPVSPDFVAGTAAMGFPLPAVFAWAAALSEFAGGLLLAIGLLTRPAAVLVGITMFVAWVGVHGAALTGENSGEMAFLYLIGAVVLGIAGPGRYSVDAAVSRRSVGY